MIANDVKTLSGKNGGHRMVWFTGRTCIAKFLGLLAIGSLSVGPAQAGYAIVEGSGTVQAVTGLQGVQPTGTVENGDALSLLFGFDPAAAPRIIDGGPSRQVFAPDIIGVNIIAGSYYFAFDGAPGFAPVLSLGTGFRLLPGDTVSSPVFIQQWSFNGLPFGDPPFPVPQTGFTGSVSFSLTSFFRADLGGATPTYADVRDPREAALTRFLFVAREGRTILGTVEGDFTGGFLVASGVPEPGTWAMLILGFGMVGRGMRAARRQAAAVLA